MCFYFYSYYEDNVYLFYNFIDRCKIGKFGLYCLLIYNFMLLDFMKFVLCGCYFCRKW